MPHQNIYEDTNPHQAREMLKQIDDGQMALPDFQRDFVWEAGATRELIVSVANNYPAGSLLRLRLKSGSSAMFQPRSFEGAAPLPTSSPNLNFLVLDGQQRLTSLYGAFYGKGDYLYFLDLENLLSGVDIDDCIFFEKKDSKRAKLLQTEHEQKARLVFPLARLFGGDGFSRWMSKVVGATHSKWDDLLDVDEEWIKSIEDFRFPVVTLSDDSSVSAICTIFETLNRTGKKLTIFDLLTARFWPKGVKLRELWESAQADHPLIEEYKIEPYSFLQVVALLSRPAPSVKNSDVLELEASDISTYWKSALAGMDEALKILQEDCGILTSKWVPYSTMLVTFAAVCAKTTTKGSSPILVQRDKLKRWFWCAVFEQTYEKAANSQVAKDYKEVCDWLKGGAEPEVVTKFSWNLGTLLNVTPRQSGLYRGTMSLIVAQNSRDFHSGKPLTSAIMRAEKVDDHHIFPKAYLNSLGITGKSVDCIINRTLIDAETNRTIGKKKPSLYLGAIAATCGKSLDPVLKSHSLPIGSTSPLQRDDFSAFLKWRETELETLINKVTS